MLDTCQDLLFCHRLHAWRHEIHASNHPFDRTITQKASSSLVVLLGWLGAEQKHLNKYADWYTSRGIKAITFILPTKDLLSPRVFYKTAKHADLLSKDMFKWLKSSPQDDAEKQGNGSKQIIFHIFSNTGWLMYGVILERIIGKGECDDFVKKIKGCIVDSAPCVKLDPRVWASGFFAAFLKRQSISTYSNEYNTASNELGYGSVLIKKPNLKEVVLVTMLEKFFSLFLKVPCVKKRLNELEFVLAHKQPVSCPHLYMYSSSDTVIPVGLIKAFIEEQKKIGRLVRSCDFKYSPHVDHFRSFPEKYSEQLAKFLKECIS